MKFIILNIIFKLIGIIIYFDKNGRIINIIVFIVISVLCAGIQFFMQSRKIKKREVKQANELRDQESREKEIEMARILLDED